MNDAPPLSSTLSPPVDEKAELKKRVWGAWATIGLGLAIGLLSIAAQTLVIIAFIASRVLSHTGGLTQEINALPTNGLVVSLAIIFSALAGIGLIALFVRLRGQISLGEYLAFKRNSWKTAIVLVLFTAGLVALAGLIGGASGDSRNSGFMVDVYNTSGWPPLLWIAVIAFAPAFEEAFFRGFSFVGLQYSRIGAIGAILFTSLVWATLHIQYDIFGMATVLVLGMVLGAVRLKTGSLWGSMLIHSLWNFVAVLGTVLSINAAH